LAGRAEVGEDEARDGDHQLAFARMCSIPFGGVGGLLAVEDGSERTAIVMEQLGEFFGGYLVDGHDGLPLGEGRFVAHMH